MQAYTQLYCTAQYAFIHACVHSLRIPVMHNTMPLLHTCLSSCDSDLEKGHLNSFATSQMCLILRTSRPSCLVIMNTQASAELPFPCIPPSAQHDFIMQAHCAQVRDCLLALPQKKWVFTNCNEKHAKLALETLQLQVMHLPIHHPRGLYICSCMQEQQDMQSYPLNKYTAV